MNYILHVFVVCLSQLMLSNFFWTFSKMEAVSVSLVCVVCLRINESKFFYRHFKLYLTATAEHFSEKFQALIVEAKARKRSTVFNGKTFSLDTSLVSMDSAVCQC